MRNVLWTLSLSLAFSSLSANAFNMEVRYRCAGTLARRSETVLIDYTEYRPRGVVVADIVYFHGLGDSYYNHLPLFNAWNEAGFRVLAFDYPGHGATRLKNPDISFDHVNLELLSWFGRAVEVENRENSQRPLFLAGWSTGGLVAIRTAQAENLWHWRRPRGLLLFAPGVALRKVIGRQSLWHPAGEITLDTLTHETAEPTMPIAPQTPLEVPHFAWHLLGESRRAFKQHVPNDLPTLVIVGGEWEDRYVVTSKVLQWAKRQPEVIFPFQCAGARHWLDREPEQYGGPEAIALSRDFARAVVEGSSLKTLGGGNVCQPVK